MKRKSNLVLILTITITLLCGNMVFADQKIFTNGSLRFVINESGSITIIEYFGDSDEVKVPMAVGPYIVEYIDEGAFADKDIKKIELPDTIVEVPSTAFEDINSIDIDFYNKNDEIVDVEKDPIVYIESENVSQIDEKKEQDDSKPEINSSFETTDSIDNEGFNEQLVDVFNDEEIKENNSSDEYSSNIQLNSNENVDLNPGIHTKTISINTGGYLLIVAIILFILIGIVLIIRKKKNRNK